MNDTETKNYPFLWYLRIPFCCVNIIVGIIFIIVFCARKIVRSSFVNICLFQLCICFTIHSSLYFIPYSAKEIDSKEKNTICQVQGILLPSLYFLTSLFITFFIIILFLTFTNPNVFNENPFLSKYLPFILIWTLGITVGILYFFFGFVGKEEPSPGVTFLCWGESLVMTCVTSIIQLISMIVNFVLISVLICKVNELLKKEKTDKKYNIALKCKLYSYLFFQAFFYSSLVIDLIRRINHGNDKLPSNKYWLIVRDIIEIVGQSFLIFYLSNEDIREGFLSTFCCKKEIEERLTSTFVEDIQEQSADL